MAICYEEISYKRTLKSHNLRNVPNNVTIPDGAQGLIKVDTVVWHESFFNQIRREMNISIGGIMSNLVDLKMYTAIYCESGMAITTWGKTSLGVLPFDP